MVGAALIVIVVVVALPVALLLGGALVSFLLGWALKAEAETRHAGTESLELNR